MKSVILLLLLVLGILSQTEGSIKLEDEAREVNDEKIPQPPKEALKQVKKPQIEIDTLAPLYKLTSLELASKFRYEIGALSLIVLYIVNYFIGKKKNQNLSETWLRAVGPTLLNNFSMVGFDVNNRNICMLEQSPHQYIFYCSGRDNLEFAEFNLQLEPREDIIFQYVMAMISPIKDLLTIDIPIDNSIPLVLYVIKKRDVKSVASKAIDMSITKEFDVANFPETYRIFGENKESVDHIIDNQVINMIKNLQGVFNSFHYTDQKVYSNSTGHLRILLNLSKEGEKNELAIKFIMYLVDKIEALKLPQNVRSKCEQSREALMATKERQDLEKKREELQKEKAEKKKKEEARIKALPADKQKKQYEKEKKREMKDFLKTRTVRM